MHAEIEVAPKVDEYEPIGQRVQLLTEVKPTEEEKDPAGHDKHVDAEDAPTLLEYVPIGQRIHELFEVAPNVWLLKLPLVQLVH